MNIMQQQDLMGRTVRSFEQGSIEDVIKRGGASNSGNRPQTATGGKCLFNGDGVKRMAEIIPFDGKPSIRANKLDSRIGIIGPGKMAEAMLAGILKANVAQADKVFTYPRREERRRHLTKTYGINCVESNIKVVMKSDVILLAVKPYQMDDMLQEIGKFFTQRHLIISVAAGYTHESISASLEKCFPGNGQPFPTRTIRTVPNTPALVGNAATVYNMNETSKQHKEDKRIVEILMNSFGICHECEEKLLDSFTGVSGSGPAYVYMFIEAMADGGVKQGIPRDIAMRFAAQTVMGAAKMVLETGQHPGQLKDNVCSPGGTTIEAVQTLESLGMRNAVMSAVCASSDKARFMASQNK